MGQLILKQIIVFGGIVTLILGILPSCSTNSGAVEVSEAPIENVATIPKGKSAEGKKGAWVEDKSAEAKRVRVERIKPEVYAASFEVSGKALAARESLLSLGVTGQIKHIAVARGDKVKKGQVLLKLDQSGYKLGVEQAQAAVAGASSTLDQLNTEIARVEQLLAEGAAPSATLDDLNAKNKGAKAQAQVANASFKQAKKALKDSVLRAPYDGVITDILKEVGEQAPAMPPTMLMKIVDAENLEVQVFVPEESGRYIKEGDTAEVTVDSAGVTAKGEIVFVSSAISPGARTFEVRVRIANPDLKIKAGSFARVRFAEAEQGESILIPVAQVKRDEADNPYVFVEKNGVAKKRPLTLGEMDGVRVRVVSGLSAGERLVVSDSAGLSDGQSVTLEN